MRFLNSARVKCAVAAGTTALLMLATCARPAQKDDPFDYLRKDERLSAEVTLRLNGEALKDVVDVIEAATGAKISVDPDIAEDKATIFCKGQSASEVMVQMAKLFGYHFRPERRAGKLYYVLFRDDATRALERRLRVGAIDEAFEKIGEVVARYAGEVVTPEGFKKQRESVRGRLRELRDIRDPFEEPLSEEEAAELLEKVLPVWEDLACSEFCLSHRGVPLLYLRLNSEQIEMLKDERKVVFSSSEYPGAYPMPQDLIGVLAEKPPSRRFNWQRDEDEGDETETQDTEPATGVRVEFESETVGSGIQVLGLSARLWHLCEDGRERYTASGSVEMPVDQDIEELLKGVLGLYQPGMDQGQAVESDEPEPSDPILQTKVKIPPASGQEVAGEGDEADESTSTRQRSASKTSPAAIFRERGLYTISHLIEDIAPQVPVSMIADHYDMSYDSPILGGTFGRHVSAMRFSGYDSAREGDWFRFRNGTWYSYRAAQVPNYIILRWIAAEKSKGGFDLTDLAEISLLSMWQRKTLSDWRSGGLSTVFESLGHPYSYFSESDWNWTRAFALCTDQQKRQLLRGIPVTLRAMPRTAQECLMEALRERASPAWTPESLAQAEFTVVEEKKRSYTLRRGASTVEEVAAYESIWSRIGEKQLEQTLEHLKKLDPTIRRDDFEVHTEIAVSFRLDSDDASASEGISLPRIKKDDAGD